MARAETASASAHADSIKGSDSIKGLAQSIAKPAYRRLLLAEPALRRAVPVLIIAFLATICVGAVVQVKPDMTVTVDELRRFVAGKIAAFKVPVEIQIQREPLPRNANGKIMKNDLRARFTPRG